MAEILPALLGGIDAQKRAAIQAIADVLANPFRGLQPEQHEAFAETPEQALQRAVGMSQSVMPQTARAGAQAVTEGALGGTPPAGQAMFVPALPAEIAAWEKLRAAGIGPLERWEQTMLMKVPGTEKMAKEISDSTAQFNIPNRIGFDQPITGPMSSVMQHPELYSRMPSLQNIPTAIESNPWDIMQRVRGGYSPPRGMDVYDIPELLESSSGDKLDRASTILHELQHAIQYRAGWPVGGSSKSVAPITSANPGYVMNLIQQVANMPVTRMMDEEAKHGVSLAQQFLQNPESVSNGDMLHILYRSLAGEAQARQTQSRMLLSQGIRQLVPPSLDVPRSSLLFRFAGQQTPQNVPLGP